MLGTRVDTALETAVRLLNSGQTVAIFPEGALSPLDGGVHRPHTGVARMALLAGVPVIPVGISLEWPRIWCADATVHGKTEVARYYLRGPYGITVGEPMRFAGNAEDRAYVRSVSERIMQRIARLAVESAERMLARQTSGSRAQDPIRLPNATPEGLSAGQ